MVLVVLLFTILSYVFSQSLYYQGFIDNTFTTPQDWTIVGASGIYSTCAGKTLLGGFGLFGAGAKVMRLFQLPPHHAMTIQLELWKFDSWDGESFYLQVDQTLIYSHTFIYNAPQISLCGIPGLNDVIENINVKLNHNFQSSFIQMTTSLDQPPSDESWGIRNFQIYLDLCPTGCKTCSSTDSRSTCFPWVLAHSAFLQIAYDNFEGWSVQNGVLAITQCGCFSLFGGYAKSGMNSRITQTIKLPPHNIFKIKFRFAYLDTWDNEYAQLYLDGILQWSNPMDLSHSRKVQDVCGNIYDDILYNQEIQIFHYRSTIKISFQSTLNESPISESFGVRDIQIFTCNKFMILACQFGDTLHFICEVCGDGIVTGTEFCDDGNTNPFDGCFGCQFSCIEGCANCFQGVCLECLIGWEFDVQFFTCTPLKNDKKIQKNEICDAFLHQYCDDGYFVCPKNCNQCSFGHCLSCHIGFILIENKCEILCSDLTIVNQIECEDFNLNGLDKCHQCQSNLQVGCQDMKYGICLQCLNGWEYNELQNQCVSICGDNMVVGIEQCEQSQSFNYGCQDCHYYCQKQCLKCKFGKCFECQLGWLLDNYKCVTVCGDGYISGLEQCDDGNQFDGCFDCKIECCTECAKCIKGKCQICNPTFTLINNQCLPICGDGLISYGYEECDDMNKIRYDGCYDCQYQCIENCQNCVKGVCKDICPFGYHLQNYKCEPVCGDKSINGNEECDDGNQMQFDGCYECQFSCPQNCQICYKGICYQCMQGFFLLLNQCNSSCGDGNFVNGIEECDDSNLINRDGCNQDCQIEEDYLCKNYNYSYSECTYEKQPRFLAYYVKQIYQEQYVNIKFSQKVKTISTEIFSNQIEAYIKNDHDISLKIIQEASDQIEEVEYLLIINEFEQPFLEIHLHDYLYNINDSPLYNLVQKVKLHSPKIITQQQKETAITLQKASTSIMGSLGGLGIVALLLGNSFAFWGLLEVLQQQSYLRFMNVVFPENLFIYFESSNIISFEPILEYFQQISNLFIQSSYLESYEKFKYYEINADIFSNLQTQVVVFITVYFSYIFAHLAYNLLKKFKAIQLGSYNIFLIFDKIRIFLVTYLIQLRKEGVKQILLANSWDLFFMSFLQLRSTQNDIWKQSLTILLAIFIIYSLIIVQLTQFDRLKQQTFIQYWSKKHNLIVTIKKLTFILILVFFQRNQEIQSLLLSFVSLLYIIFICRIKPVNDYFELLKLYIMEFSVLIFTFTTFIYWNSVSNYISYQKQVILGWFHIVLLLSVLIINLALQVYVLLKGVLEKAKQFNGKKKSISPFPLETVLQQYQI